MAEVYLKKNEEGRIKSGHLWIFSNEVERIEGAAANGDIVNVFDSKNTLIGSGFYNRNSLISVRLLSSSKINDLYSVLKEKILSAYRLRKMIYHERVSYRVVFSESDFLPGLIIDKYNSTFVMQVYSYGMEKNIHLITRILKEDLEAKNIFTKNEPYFRLLEGLPEKDELFLGSIEDEIISDGKVYYKIDFHSGHKTGFYFDQNDNRNFIERFSEGKTVLDAFCNSGGFGLHAAYAKAASVTFIDSSPAEIENVRINFSINKFSAEACSITGDVFSYFEKCSAEGKKFDLIILDPPAFAKNKKNLPKAKKGYEKLNRIALNLLTPGGILATSSCSYHISEGDFRLILAAAAAKSGREIRFLYFSGASLDHPRLPAMPETSYLKFALLAVQ